RTEIAKLVKFHGVFAVLIAKVLCMSYRPRLSIVWELYIGSIGRETLKSGGPVKKQDLNATGKSAGGEIMADEKNENKKQIMTTDAGRPVGDNQNSLTVGPRGPVVFEDFLLFEKMAHFNRERIPERVVHAKGSGAHGYFVCTSSEISKYTTAK